MNYESEQLEAALNRHFDRCWNLAQYITKHPEIGGTERLAVAKYRQLLTEEGFIFDENIGKMEYSFKASRPKENPKMKVALLCEYDALPELGHACGHSVSGAASVLTALSVSQLLADLPIQIDLIGTPNEEQLGGKVRMAKYHVFDPYDFAMMAHLDKVNRPQLMTLACAGMRITFHGIAAHASSCPEQGINALNAAQLFMHGIDMMRQHIPSDCQVHGIITDGGSAPNIVPDQSVLEYYYRAGSMPHLDLMKEHLSRCAQGAALITGCTYDLDPNCTEVYADLSQLPTAIDLFSRIFERYNMDYEVATVPDGSTDAGNVDLIIPTFHIEIKATDDGIETHTPAFEKLLYGENGQHTLYSAAKVMSSFILQLVQKPQLLEKIKEEHRRYRQI